MVEFDVIGCAKAQISNGNGVTAVNEFLSILEKNHCASPICIACSGGSDSVFLVKYVADRFPGLGKFITLLHFNHGLRGSESDGDEEFVEALAKAGNMDFVSKRLEPKPENASEGFLRWRRNEFFEWAMGRLGSKVLILGHQRNDVAETLLMRLTRASDTDGLSAPRAMTIFGENYVKLRPLLEISKDEILFFLSEHSVGWRCDKSNYTGDFFRNRIRNFILPKLQDAAGNFDVWANLSTAKRNIEEADDAVNFFARHYLADRNLRGEMAVADLMNLPSAVLKKVFAAFLSANGVEVRGSYLELFLGKMRSTDGTPFSIGRCGFAKFDGESFRIVGKIAGEDWVVENLTIGENALPNGRVLKIENVDMRQRSMDDLRAINAGTHCYASISNGAKITARNYKPRYRYVPFGHGSRKKLGDVITAKIFECEVRVFLPVIFVDNEVCWVPGLPVSEFFRIKEKKAEALLLTYL
ncbi:MAG: tRNA lysidine(34) synthetase TilS [Puniceicoccales bacterium]|nr:tRNA lysidine(34) synthetase TilS [Puniceicoccales bacterium]